MSKQSNGQHINCDAMDFVLRVTQEAGADFVSHTYFFDFICDEEKNILSSPPGSGKTIALIQYVIYKLHCLGITYTPQDHLVSPTEGARRVN